jgi:hypothetical protein
MRRSRLAVSVFVAWHLTAIAVAAIPPPEDVRVAVTNRPPVEPISAWVAPRLDAVAAAASAAHRAVWAATAPLRPVVSLYVGLTGLAQHWAMFWNISTNDRYARVRYYVGPVSSAGDERPAWMATELVLPAHREDRVRLLQSYRDSYRDKAMEIATTSFLRRRPPALIRPDTRPGELPDDLAPIARYFGRRFEGTHLSPGERILRTEVWLGTAPNPPPGSPGPVSPAARRSALGNYDEGPVQARLHVPPYPPYHAEEREADITWLLEYYEEP